MSEALIEELMKIEDPFIKLTIELKKAQKKGLRKNDQGYEFQSGHTRHSIDLIEKLMDLGLSIEDIKQKIEEKRSTQYGPLYEFVRTHNILDNFDEGIPPPISEGIPGGKSGLKKKKKSKKKKSKKKKSKKKKKSNKKKRNKRR